PPRCRHCDDVNQAAGEQLRDPLADRGLRDTQFAGCLRFRPSAVGLQHLDPPLVDLVEYARARWAWIAPVVRPVRPGTRLSGHPAHLCVREPLAIEAWFEFRLS